MPYNFELTFTQPLLTQLDSGTLNGAKDWANAITKAYVNTIKAGLPMGVPPILPAPGLNPTAPPPFAIGVSGFSTADARSRRMYKVLHAYFAAKEMKLDKASIQSLGSTIALLIKKSKNGVKQVKRIIEQIKLVKEELKELPKLLLQIIQDIKDEVKQQIADIEDAFKILDGFKTTLPPGEFESLFAKEIELLQKIKSIDITNLKNVMDLVLLFSDYGKRSDSFVGAFDSTNTVKQYLIRRLTGAIKIFAQLAEGVVDPTKILNVIRDLAAKRDRVKLLLARLNQFDFFVRYLKPKLLKLNKRKKEWIAKVRTKIQNKIVDLRKKLQKKIEDFVRKKKDGVKRNLYSKSAKDKIDRKKKNAEKIKLIRAKLKRLRKIYKTSVEIVGKSVVLVNSAKSGFDDLKKDIENYLKKLEETRQAIIKLANNPNQLNVINPEPTLPTFVPPQISLNSIEQNKVEQEAGKLVKYFAALSIPQFGELAAKTLVDIKCDYQTFVRFFEKGTKYVQMYLLELVDLVEKSESLYNDIKTFKDVGTKRENLTQPPKATFWSKRIKSLKDLLRYIAVKLIPKVQSYPRLIKRLLKKQKTKLEKVKDKFKKDLKVFTINMIPIKSDVQDRKDKATEIAAKEKKIKTKVRQIRRVLRLASYTAKMVKGGVAVYNNTEKGDYTLNSNQLPITNMIDGYYLIKSDSQPLSVQATLQKEKVKVLNTFKGLVIVDTFGRALIGAFEGKEKIKIAEDIDMFIKSIKDNPPAVQTLSILRDLFLSPPTSIDQLKKVLNNLALSALQDYLVINKLIDIEKKYLRQAKQAILTLLDAGLFKGTKHEKKIKTFYSKIKKRDSFIMLLIDLIKKAVDDIKKMIKLKIQKIAKKLKEALRKKKVEKEQQGKKELIYLKNKKVNVDAIVMNSVFSLAARLFWIGAGWVGPSGSQHRVLTIGSFRPRVKGRPEDGASAAIRQIAKAFEFQLMNMRGFVTPIAATGIPPLPFNGYK